jgi:hypothetical protein
MTERPELRLLEADLLERDVRLRLPFRFGVVTLTEAPQVFVRARIRMQDGREGEGVSAEVLAPKWFDKSPDLTNEENFDQLRISLAVARRALLGAGENTPFGLSASVEATIHAECAARNLGGLVATFGLALLDRAILDALGRLENRTIFQLAQENRFGLTDATAPDIAGFDLDEFLAGLRPARTIHARHTVGLVDALTKAETEGKRLDDGLPESLEEAVAAYGHRYFKLKVGGDLAADIGRLSGIAAVLDRATEPYFATLDGNEQYHDIDGVAALWRRIGDEPRLARMKSSILFIEQPIARSAALEKSVTCARARDPPRDRRVRRRHRRFPRARELGYRGISSKACKGFYRALLNRARVEKWNAEEGAGRYFMSAEDLTTQSGVAVQQDLAQALLIGATHVERNGHHYVDGMAGAPEAEQEAFLAAHPDLYRRTNGRVRLAIRGGELALGSLHDTPGLATGPMPDFSAMKESASQE